MSLQRRNRFDSTACWDALAYYYFVVVVTYFPVDRSRQVNVKKRWRQWDNAVSSAKRRGDGGRRCRASRIIRKAPLTRLFFFLCVCVPGGDLSHSTRIRNRSKKTKEYSTWLKDEISKKKKNVDNKQGQVVIVHQHRALSKRRWGKKQLRWWIEGERLK